MAGENTFTTMEMMYKEVYGDTLLDVVPMSSVVYDIVKYKKGKKLGKKFVQTAALTLEHGFTSNGVAGSVVTLKDPVNAVFDDANIQGVELIGRSRIAYTAASSAVSEGPEAFADAWTQVLVNLRKASMKRLELQLLRGTGGLGILSGNSSGTLTLTDASWSPSTWAGMKGCIIEAWDGIGYSADNQHNGDLTISAVSRANKTVTVTGTNTNVTTGDYLFFDGHRTASASNEMTGLVQCAANSGTLHGISGATYDTWLGNTFSMGGAPTMGKFLTALNDAIDMGLEEKAYLLVPTATFAILNANVSTSRRFDGSYSRKQASNGAQAISFFGASGELEVRLHPYLWKGEAVAFPESAFDRIGSADMGMGVPGLPDSGSQIFFHDTTTNSAEARSFSHQALFCKAPSQCVYINGITYPTA